MAELPSCCRCERGEELTEVGDIHGKEDAQREMQIAIRPTEIPEENVERQAVAAKGQELVSCTVQNDLSVAAEIEFGKGGGWQIIYPEAKIKLAVHSMADNVEVSVRLRDDANVCGMCTAMQGSTLMLSADFGDFGDRATKLIGNEEITAKQESRLRKQRQKEINQQLNEEMSQTIRWRQKAAMISIAVCMLIPLGAMVACTVAAFSATEQGVGLALALLGLCSCAACGCYGLGVAAGGVDGTSELQAVATHPELQHFKDMGVCRVAVGDDDCGGLTLASCVCCFPLVVLGCMAAMTVASGLNRGWALALLWGSLALVMCCGGVIGWREAGEGASWRKRAGDAFFLALVFPFFWPYALLVRCGFTSRFTALLLKPPKNLLDKAVNTTHEHTIVFEGNVLQGRETVCSWPGKYATAWDTLVAGARTDDISAAVVFLPEGSQHFGFHDPIPPKEGLHGDCWCTPLYGECKPWGCRWWSKWIANIELTVAQECTVVVYYFNGRRGQGKVKDFATAGEEHLRREAIEQRNKVFLESEAFRNALEAGLKHLSKEKGPDSSSPYSREVQRLFLARLPEEDRQFLVSSEGLGNSQKAEVAWLERKGYPYIEKEVSELESESPKAIRRAATP